MLLLCPSAVVNRSLHFLSRVVTDVVDETARATADESLQRITDSRNRAVIEPDEAIRKRDQQKEAEELCHAESWTTLRGCESLLHSEPDEHDGGKRYNHVQSKRIHRRRDCCREIVATVFDQNEKIHNDLACRSVMKCPLRSCSRLLGRDGVEVLLITVAQQKQRLEIVLLNLLPDHLLQRLRLQHLIGLLLRAQFDQQRLVDTLQRGHLGMLSRIGGMTGSFKLADVGFTLRRICADGPDRLQIGRIRQNRRDRLLRPEPRWPVDLAS